MKKLLISLSILSSLFAAPALSQERQADKYYVVSSDAQSLILVPNSYIREGTFAAGWILIFLPSPNETPLGTTQGAWILNGYDCVNRLVSPIRIEEVSPSGAIVQSLDNDGSVTAQPVEEATPFDAGLSLACADGRYKPYLPVVSRENANQLIEVYDQNF